MSFKSCNTANRACSLIYSYIKTYNQGRWLLPVNVCPDVPLTFCLAGIEFEFVDIDINTLCIDEDECLKRLSDFSIEYVGLVFVRSYGYLSDTSEFFMNCKSIRPNIKILDDRCLCIPERIPNFYNSDMVLYSTGHCKQIDLGGGGLAYYSSEETYFKDPNLIYDGTDEEALYKKSYVNNTILSDIPKGWLKLDDYMDYESYISEIDSKKLQRISQRQKINTIYQESLPVNIQLPFAYNKWRFNICVPCFLKEKILQGLFSNGLFASNHYHSANKLFNKTIYPNSDKIYASIINLFNDGNYSENQALQTTEIINKIVK